MTSASGIPTLYVRHFPGSSPESKRIRAEFPPPLFDPTVSVEQERRSWQESAQKAPLPPHTTIEPLEADGVYCEKIACEVSAPRGVMVYFHGGGYRAGSCITHREFGARISRTINLPVLLVQYRLAPEHPFPAGLEDCVRAYRWLVQNGTPPQQIVFAGDSAGGGLVAATLLALKEGGDPMPAAGVLLSAWMDLSVSGESYQSRRNLDPLATVEALYDAAREYVGAQDPRTPLISPIFADMAGLPPLLIQVGDYEIFLSDSVTLAENAARAGVAVELQIWDELWHVFQAWAAALPEGRAALAEIGRFVNQHLAA